MSGEPGIDWFSNGYGLATGNLNRPPDYVVTVGNKEVIRITFSQEVKLNPNADRDEVAAAILKLYNSFSKGHYK